MKKGKILALIGTRPEAIKMLPILKEIEQEPEFCLKLGSTGQHRELMDKTLQNIPVHVDWNLNLMKTQQSVSDVAARCLEAIPQLLDDFHPDIVLVQGDTTTAVMAGMSAFFRKIPVAHIEAGLRTHKKYSPFPEEMNRMMLSVLSDLHFCPTEKAKDNLLNEGISESAIFVTGNTSIDALKEAWDLKEDHPQIRSWFKPLKQVLVTAHRRENFGFKMRHLFQGIRKIADAFSEFQFIFPVHPNPEIKNLAESILSNHDRITLVEPVNYSEMVFLLRHSSCVLTDSGGLQEEAPTLGVPTLILREDTERPEALDTGFAKLVGTDPQRVFAQFHEFYEKGFLNQKARWVGGPFGNGDASQKIREALKNWWEGPVKLIQQSA